MKTRIVPAQITTVEDKVAGNLNFTQILLFVASLVINMAIYSIFEPLKINGSKLILMFFVFAIFGTSALKIRQRLIINWIVLFFSFALRPKIYIFDKTNNYLRD